MNTERIAVISSKVAHMRVVSFIACVVMTAALSVLGAEELPPLTIVKNDTLILKRNNERIPGIINEKRDDGTIIFTEIGRSRPLPYTKDQYDTYEERQDASQAVLNRGRILLKRKDAIGVKQCVTWGLENEAAESSLTLALEAVPVFPADTAIGTLALQMLSDQGRAAEREPVARLLLEKNPRFEPAFIVIADSLRQRSMSAELSKLIDSFLAVMPTSEAANKLKAEQDESHDLRGAQEAYRKGWELHGDLGSALGYARTSVLIGDYEAALKGATALADANTHVAEARALAGTALLAQGRIDDARAALAAAVADGSLGEPYAGWARYNLGVAEYRLGNTAAAQEKWTAANSPVAQLALAIADHKPFTAENSLPASAALRAVVREHNACMALERGQADKALAGLDTKSNVRHQFLAQVAQVLKTGGGDASLHQLAAIDTVESQRWRAYGFLLARKWVEAEAVLAKLPPDDGYAAVYRIYAAAAQKDLPRAKDLFRKLSTSANAPADYVAVLAAEYAADNEEVFNESFDWVDGDRLASGWQVEAVETNIRVHVQDGFLVLEGLQSASPQPISRAWKMAAADRVSRVTMSFDIASIESAQVGMELLDDGRQNGVAYGILADNKLGYRTLRSGQWSEWQALPLRAEGTKPTLQVEITAGRVFAIAPDNPRQRHAMGDTQLPTTGFFGVGPFGQSEPGVNWRVAVDSLDLQMKAQVRGR